MGSRFVRIDDWIHIKISGPQVIEYLNGIITKDLNVVDKGQIVRSAFLTPKAKIRSIYWLQKKDNVVFMYCPAKMKQELIEDLLKYKLSMDVKLEDITDEEAPLYIIEDESSSISGLSNDTVGFTIVSEEEEPGGVRISYDDFVDFLVINGIAPAEIMIGENPYEVGIKDAISLEKGCFLGQEPISRMYHRGNPRQYLYHFKSKEPISSSPVMQEGEEVGHLLITAKSNNNHYGIGFIRRRIEDFSNLKINDKSVSVLDRIGSYPKNMR